EQAARLAGEAKDDDLALEARARLAAGEESKPGARIAALRAIVAEAHAAGARRAGIIGTVLLADILNENIKASEAVPLLTAALEQAHASPDPARAAELEAMLEREIGTSHYCLGDADRALSHLERSLALASDAKLLREQARGWAVVGAVHLWL